MSATDAAARAIARASLLDYRIREDAAVIAAWADVLERHHLPEHLVLQAVTLYYEEPRDRSIQVGDAVRIARNLRQNEALASNVEALPSGSNAGELSRPDGPSTHPGGLNATGKPIRRAYEHDGTIYHECPICHAPSGSYCVQNGKQLRIAHAKRYGLAYRASQVEVIQQHPPTF